MKLLFIHNIILNHLLDDDEPLNLILEETRVKDRFKARLKSPYVNQVITENEIKDALKEMIINGMVTVLNEKGKVFAYNNLDEVLDETTPWTIWLRLTTKGKAELSISDNDYWKDD